MVNRFHEIGEPDGFHVKNTFEAANILNGLELEKDEVMLSFDVESLFSNIPVADTMEFVIEFLEKHNVPLNEQETLLRLTKLCMENSHFTYRRKYYKLNDGCAMGMHLVLS